MVKRKRKLLERGVAVRLFQRSDLFIIPRSFYEYTSKRAGGGHFVERGDQQVMFLCSDVVVFSFWTKTSTPGRVEHQLVGLPLPAAFEVPGLQELWTWKNLGKTWGDIERQISGADRTGSPEGKSLN